MRRFPLPEVSCTRGLVWHVADAGRVGGGMEWTQEAVKRHMCSPKDGVVEA